MLPPQCPCPLISPHYEVRRPLQLRLRRQVPLPGIKRCLWRRLSLRKGLQRPPPGLDTLPVFGQDMRPMHGHDPAATMAMETVAEVGIADSVPFHARDDAGNA